MTRDYKEGDFVKFPHDNFENIYIYAGKVNGYPSFEPVGKCGFFLNDEMSVKKFKVKPNHFSFCGKPYCRICTQEEIDEIVCEED